VLLCKHRLTDLVCPASGGAAKMWSSQNEQGHLTWKAYICAGDHPVPRLSHLYNDQCVDSRSLLNSTSLLTPRKFGISGRV
jgi:hypothetical protein